MPMGPEVEAAVGVLKRFAQQMHDRHVPTGRTDRAAEETARIDIELADIEAMLAGVRRIRTELERQMMRRPFISPWI